MKDNDFLSKLYQEEGKSIKEIDEILSLVRIIIDAVKDVDIPSHYELGHRFLFDKDGLEITHTLVEKIEKPNVEGFE